MNTTTVPLHRLVLPTFAAFLLTVCSQKGAPSLKDASHAVTDPASVPSNAKCSPARAAGTNGIIDDFEDDPGRIVNNEGRDGSWFSYDDGTGGRLVREEIIDGTRVLHVTSSGFSDWGAGVGATFLSPTSSTQACPYDASAYSGIRFRARGRGRTRMEIGSVTNTPRAKGGRCTRTGDNCEDSPGVWVELTEQWQTVEQPFCAFIPEGWGGDRLGLDVSELVNVRFWIEARPGFELWLDDLEFFVAEQGAAQPKCGQKCPLEAVPRRAVIDPASPSMLLTEELTLHTLQQSTKSCGALTRRYLSYVPKRLERQTSAPVVMVLHGSKSNAESMQQYMTRGRFDQLAARDGFVVVYGNAAPGAYVEPVPYFPNNGSWRQDYFDDGEVDDVEYLCAVLDDLKARGVTRGNNAVYLTGLSNGGGMVLEAARRAPERFRGIAPFMAFDGAHPKPVPDLRGKGLNRVLLVYTVNDPGLPSGYDDVLRSLFPQWALALGVPQTAIDNPKRTDLPDRIREGEGYSGRSKAAQATRNSRATQYDLADANADAQLRLVVIDHAGHFWPNPAGDTATWATNRWGFRNQDFDAADMVWDFFSSGASELSRQPAASE